MSTRGAIGFRIDGQDKVTYNHSDSYPSCLGADVVGFIRKTPINDMVEAACRIELVTDGEKPTPEQIQDRSMFCNPRVGNQSQGGWYSLLRDAQGDLSAYTNGLMYMIDSHTFLRDSLCCEYAYIINLDDMTLEFYQGFNHSKDAPGRYAKFEDEESWRNGSDRYFGVRLVKTYTLLQLKALRSSVSVVKEMEKMTERS